MVVTHLLVVACALLAPVQSIRDDAMKELLDIHHDSLANRTENIVLKAAMKMNIGGSGLASAPEEPAWKSMPMGCEESLNTGYCELTLLQSACVAKHGEIDGITAADACQKIWPSGDKAKASRHLYCLAAAADPKVIEFVQGSLKDLAPDECNVNVLSHFKTGQHTKTTAEERVERAMQFGSDVSTKVKQGVRKACKDYLATEPDSSNSGFCSKDSKKGDQDCEFIWGIKQKWNKEYGKEFCNSLPRPGQLRCLGLRKQIIRIASAKSYFGTAFFTPFDDAIRIPEETCPPEGSD